MGLRQAPDQADRRKKFDQELRDLQIEHLGYQHTYFQPTERVRLQYDAIVYSITGFDQKTADNKGYVVRPGYQVTCISKDPETPLPMAILYHFERCSPGLPFVSENLYHFPFTIYY